ncbi:hypothetical protein GOBAR_AA10734 [Gossypium barbadense]|uniref:Endonuclease/exonuclease/phosphatase domain-containing protein n=1 Tax=Gossypium barbadense TaxID=3634 RepID=A0A2P5Y2V3_GOSBA|nr:hypothetical protein GOBAR_AA10734 [Gossypium barbadense]
MDFIFYYASPRLSERILLWQNLKDVEDNHNLPWLVTRDFNEAIGSSAELRGLPPSNTRIRDFQDCLNHYNLIDIGFKGSKFTWFNLSSVETELKGI